MVSEPSFARLRFLPDCEKPLDVWQKCKENQGKWNSLSQEGKSAERVKEFYTKMVVEIIWMANKLEDTLPEGVTKNFAEETLRKAYERDELQSSEQPSLCQLIQHVKAFKLLCQKKKQNSFPVLTEALIKQVHGIMMAGLTNEDGLSVDAGSYRTISVRSGDHVYPCHTCIPQSMKEIVEEYNERHARPDHDAFELASWLHYSIVSLHPFIDGNGRLSRLLWCYSLMRDGLPFPALLTSGHKKSQKHLVLCLQRDRDRLSYNDTPHMSTLTVASVLRTWQDFWSTVEHK